MDRNSTIPIVKVLQERKEQVRQVALHEIRELRKALIDLEQFLAGKRKRPGPDLFDVVHSAFEIFRTSSALADYGRLMEEMDSEVERSQALTFLEAKGAQLLMRPAGWHWISPKGEMHFLAKKNEPGKASEALAKLLAGGKQRRTRSAKASSADSEQADKVQKDAPAAESTPVRPGTSQN